MVENDACSGGSSKQNALFEKIWPKKLTYDLLSRIGSGSISFAGNWRKFLFMNLIYIMNLQQLFTNPWLFHCFPLVETENKESNFQQLGALTTKNTCLLIMTSCALIQMYVKFNRSLKRHFIWCYFCL